MVRYAFAAAMLFAASAVLASSPQPGDACSGSTAYCLSIQSPIILRCTGSTLSPGNCNDNLNEPPLGAICVQSSPTAGDAQCKAVTAPSEPVTSSSAAASSVSSSVSTAFSVPAPTDSSSVTAPVSSSTTTATTTSSIRFSNGTVTSSTPITTSFSNPISISTALAPGAPVPAAAVALAGLLGLAVAAL